MFEVPAVCFDFGHHSCIVLRMTERKAYVIPMTSDGMSLEEWPLSRFKERRDATTGKILNPEWVPSKYPVGRAAAHYLASTRVIPITKGARQQLEKITSPLDISPAAVEAAAIAFVNTERQKQGLPRLADEEGPIHKADLKESTTMATAKKTAPVKEAKKPAAKAKTAAPAKEAKKPAAKAKTAAPAKEGTGRQPGVGALIIEGLLAGKEADEIMMDVASKFPEAKTTKTNISWYKSKLKREGKL